MSVRPVQAVPRLHGLPSTLPSDGAVRIEMEEGKPVLRASAAVQTRIEDLLQKQRETGLSADENEELDQYEEIDDYLSLVNRVVRNLPDAPAGDPILPEGPPELP